MSKAAEVVTEPKPTVTKTIQVPAVSIIEKIYKVGESWMIYLASSAVAFLVGAMIGMFLSRGTSGTNQTLTAMIVGGLFSAGTTLLAKSLWIDANLTAITGPESDDSSKIPGPLYESLQSMFKTQASSLGAFWLIYSIGAGGFSVICASIQFWQARMAAALSNPIQTAAAAIPQTVSSLPKPTVAGQKKVTKRKVSLSKRHHPR